MFRPLRWKEKKSIFSSFLGSRSINKEGMHIFFNNGDKNEKKIEFFLGLKNFHWNFSFVTIFNKTNYRNSFNGFIV